MGVQTLKHAALLAAGLVGAVLLIQGLGSTVSVPGSVVGGISFASGTSSIATTTDASAPLTIAKSTSASDTKTAAVATQSTFSDNASQAVGTKPAEGATSAPVASGHSAEHTLISSVTPPAQKTTPPATPTPTCPAAISGSTPGAPSEVSENDIPGTSSADLQGFADAYNAIRVANCLRPIPFSNIRFSECLQQRMFWMADDPSSNPASAWGHTGTAKRSDGVPIVGCDGDLAGGDGYTTTTVAEAWWDSIDHRDSLYQPSYTGSLSDVCIYFAMSHGGYNNPGPNEPYSFVRAAAYWAAC